MSVHQNIFRPGTTDLQLGGLDLGYLNFLSKATENGPPPSLFKKIISPSPAHSEHESYPEEPPPPHTLIVDAPLHPE